MEAGRLLDWVAEPVARLVEDALALVSCDVAMAGEAEDEACETLGEAAAEEEPRSTETRNIVQSFVSSVL